MVISFTPEKLAAMQTELLLDIYSWQIVLVNKLAALEATDRNLQLKEVTDEWEALKKEIRVDCADQIYAKFGPDMKSVD